MKKKRSAVTVLRERNRELREARAENDKLTATPSFLISELRDILRDAECQLKTERKGYSARVFCRPRFDLSGSRELRVSDIVQRTILVMKDVE